MRANRQQDHHSSSGRRLWDLTARPEICRRSSPSWESCVEVLCGQEKWLDGEEQRIHSGYAAACIGRWGLEVYFRVRSMRELCTFREV